ncbi:hypothetical protein HI806_09440 [Ralstonia solanacearum]|nr:hypothetical protein BCR16_09100 [Ralstonia solanacearum FJAT-1458]QKL71488.1 hypothetical protein HI806_09440 [Ralstonia solanacearum]QKL76697.1 hypothetical protein HI805_09450 [Ralstonia solanacearum]QKL81901.1 hypothetical protein HI804_09450 [Ralstonia solanacearum]QKL87112.1 hypothetical protein HI803_09455 [Ralstonia solanacearum]
MDYRIESIDVIEACGRLAMRNGLEPDMCPYDDDTAHWRTWQQGYLTARLVGVVSVCDGLGDEAAA